MNRIITIGRELGRRLSEIMEIAYYDQEACSFVCLCRYEKQVKRCREKDPEENRTDAALEREILKIDKGRASYYNHFTGLEWGNREHYDLCMNTTNCEIKNLAQRLSGMFY